MTLDLRNVKTNDSPCRWSQLATEVLAGRRLAPDEGLAILQSGDAELLDLLPLMLENIYNAIDRDNGAIRVHALVDRILVDSQGAKEICNMMHLRVLGCSTGTLQDFGPDFGLTYVLDGLSMMGQ